MSEALAVKRVSYATYLAMEARSEVRLEFVDGWVVAMTGGTTRHARLAGRIIRALGNSLEGGPCEPYSSDLKVWVEEARRATYSDVTVVCGEPASSRIDANAITNPAVLVEVLSPSTEADDRGPRWHDFRSLPSLKHYVLVSQNEKRIEVFTRDGDGWRYDEKSRGTVKLAGIRASFSVDALYRGIALPKPANAVRPRPRLPE